VVVVGRGGERGGERGGKGSREEKVEGEGNWGKRVLGRKR